MLWLNYSIFKEAYFTSVWVIFLFVFLVLQSQETAFSSRLIWLPWLLFFALGLDRADLLHTEERTWVRWSLKSLGCVMPDKLLLREKGLSQRVLVSLWQPISYQPPFVIAPNQYLPLKRSSLRWFPIKLNSDPWLAQLETGDPRGNLCKLHTESPWWGVFHYPNSCFLTSFSSSRDPEIVSSLLPQQI